MDPAQVNYVAVFVAALSSFLIGGVWYSPILFAKAWMRETGLREEEVSKGLAKVFSGAFLCSLIIALNLAFFLGPKSDLVWGMTAGALAGIGWVAASLGLVYLFERRSPTLFFIDAGYQAVAYTVMGAILGVWK